MVGLQLSKVLRMIISYRYRLLPEKRQHRALEHILESQRQLYNAALEERIGAYRKAGKSITYIDQTKGLTAWRQSDLEARALPVKLQRATLRRLDEAYRELFRRIRKGRRGGFPRFKGAGRFNAFGFSEFEGITLRDGRLRFKGMPGSLRVHWHRELPPGAQMGACRFKRDASGWTVSFTVTVDAGSPRKGSRSVGVDLGIYTFAALSDGGCIPSLRAARKADRRLRVAHRALSRKIPHSNGHRRARVTLSRCHATVARQRMEHLHQASSRLVRDYDVIAVEDLNVERMAHGLLAKSVHDMAWGKFISMLRYKAKEPVPDSLRSILMEQARSVPAAERRCPRPSLIAGTTARDACYPWIAT